MQQHYRINCGFKYLVLFHTQGLHSLELTCSLASLAAIELPCLPELLMEVPVAREAQQYYSTTNPSSQTSSLRAYHAPDDYPQNKGIRVVGTGHPPRAICMFCMNQESAYS